MIKKLTLALFLFGWSLTGFANNFWDKHTLILFFSSECPHCKNMGRIIGPWLKETQVPFVAFSFDGRGLPEVSSFKKPTRELINAAFPSNNVVYPALFIIERESLKLYPVAYGEIGYTELTSRINSLVPKVIQHEEGAL